MTDATLSRGKDELRVFHKNILNFLPFHLKTRLPFIFVSYAHHLLLSPLYSLLPLFQVIVVYYVYNVASIQLPPIVAFYWRIRLKSNYKIDNFIFAEFGIWLSLKIFSLLSLWNRWLGWQIKEPMDHFISYCQYSLIEFDIKWLLLWKFPSISTMNLSRNCQEKNLIVD